VLGTTALIGFISVPLALVIALALTGLAAALIGKVIPNDDSNRERRSDLVGKAGEAMYDIDSQFGMAKVRGEAGDFFPGALPHARGHAADTQGRTDRLVRLRSREGRV